VWIELTYPSGDRYGSHCSGAARTARIVFLCDPNVAGMVREALCGPTRNHLLMFPPLRVILTFWRRIVMMTSVTTCSLLPHVLCVGMSSLWETSCSSC